MKMWKIIEVISCTFFFYGTLLGAQGSVCSSPHTTMIFSQCLVAKLNHSPFFTQDERESMSEVANVMLRAMRNMDFRPEIPSVRILAISFVTSIADIIITHDVRRNIPRKGAYSKALEECSILWTGYIDSEFITEAMRIMSIIENETPPEYEESDYEYKEDAKDVFAGNDKTFQVSEDHLNPFAPQPTPEQTHFDRNLNRNAKMDFLTSDNFNPSSGLSRINVNYPFPVGSEIKSVSPFKSDSGNIAQTRTVASTASASALFQQEMKLPSSRTNSGPTNFEFSGLNIPQTKESSVVVIQPPAPFDTGRNLPVQKQMLPKTPEFEFQEYIPTNESAQQESFINQTSYQEKNYEDLSIPFSPSLEDLIFDILTNSTSFNNAFSFVMDDQKAINLARSIIEETLIGYNREIINAALEAVSDAVHSVKVNTPENYALAVSGALGFAFRLHSKSFFDEAQLVSSILSNIGNDTQTSFEDDRSDEQIEVELNNNKTNEWKKHIPFDFQIPVLEPEDIEGDIFSNSLYGLLSNSEDIANIFCKSSSLQTSQVCFRMIKLSLVDYGTQVSTISASTILSSLSELTDEQQCANYARIISNVIAEVLDESDLLKYANPEDILNKMETSLKQIVVDKNSESQQPVLKVTNNTRVNDDVFNQNMPHNGSSSSSDYYDDAKEDMLPPYVEQPNTEYFNPVTESSQFVYDDHSEGFKQENESIRSPNADAVAIKQMLTQMSYEDKPESKYKINNDFKEPTSSAYKEITDKEFENATVLINRVTSLLDTLPTDMPLNSSSPSAKIEDQVELALILIEEMHSVLEAWNSNSTESEEFSTSSEEDFTEIFVPKSTDINNQTSLDETSSHDKPSTSNSRRNKRKNRRRKKTTTVQPNRVTSATLIQEYEAKEDNAEVIILDQVINKNLTNLDKPLNDTSELDSDITPSSTIVNKYEEKTEDNSSGAFHSIIEDKTSRHTATAQHAVKEQNGTLDVSLSRDANFSSVNLQPSFKQPQSSDTSSPTKLILQQDSTDFDKEETHMLTARAVSEISASSIAYIRSENFNIYQLCDRLNELAEILNLPPINYCDQFSLVDFLLHALQSVTKILKNV